MIDETTHDAKKSKKVDKRMSRAKCGKNPPKFDKVNNQVLTKDSTFSETFFALRRFLIKFINNKDKSPQNFFKKLKHKVSGYVLMLFLVTLPVLLLGTKYVLDQMSADQAKIEKGTETYHKRCAREAALAVAKNWNPGLTLGQQQAAVYKVADAVYDNSPCYNDSVVGGAVAGLDVKKSHTTTQTGSKFNPIKVIHTEVASKKTISYTTVSNRKFWNNYAPNNYKTMGLDWNPNYILWGITDVDSNPSNRSSVYDEIDENQKAQNNYILKHHDIHATALILPKGNTCGLFDGLYYPNNTIHSSSADDQDVSRFVVSTISKDTDSSDSITLSRLFKTKHNVSGYYSSWYYSASTYKIRDEQSGTDPIKISVDSDQIKVETDSHVVNNASTVAKAVPAQCNVDIVLAIPVNGAACNPENKDAASDTPGIPTDGSGNTYKAVSSDVKSTPLYQMGQACKNFVKDNFYHTRGVYMSLIPYSGKLSISPDRATAWTTTIPQFDSSSTNTQLMIGSCLYGTSGEKDAPLTQAYKTKSLARNWTLPTTDTPFYWGGQLTGCPIMCRRGTRYQSADYGNNYFHGGKLLDTNTPNNNNLDYRYMRMNLNPCYVGYANTLSMKCEKQCTHFLPNPYYMIEPTADMVKIYEMCNALYPIYDTHNVSNFVFAALEWANNMFQSWTTNPSVSTTAGTASDAVLSRESKTTSTRKKVVILLVNKPDWFEPGEMTYLGFNNDYSEVSTAEADKIDFSIDYSNTNSEFLDGTAYDGTFAGQKRILTMEKQSGDNLTRTNGYYECGEGKYRLKFPHKGTIKLTVAPAANASSSSGSGSITFYDTNIGSTNDVHKDSLSGSTISLGTAQTVTGSQEFVFSGGTIEGRSYGSKNSTEGKNFCHNLSVKKVHYCLSNASIVNCTLKNQILRNYMACYGYSNPNFKQLILNDESVASRGSSTNYAYSPYYTGSLTSNITITAGDSNDVKMSKFQDSCIKYVGTYRYDPRSSFSLLRVGSSQGTPCYMMCYGVTSPFYISMLFGTSTSPICYYYNTSGSYVSLCSSRNTKYYCSPTNGYSYSPAAVRLKFVDSSDTYGDFIELFIQNTQDKTLQSTTPITSNPLTYSNLINNVGIYLANYNNENWICFQGDGELHVTVKGGASKPELKFGYVSGDTAAHEITDETTYVITPDKITGGSDGDYYIDLDMKSLKLISAEITNRTCASIANPISATYVDDVKTVSTTESKTDTITFSSQTSGSNGLISYSTQSGLTSVVSGGRECTGSATGRLSFPYKGTVSLKVTKGSATESGDPSTLQWVERSSGVSVVLVGVTYCNGKFFIGGCSGNVLVSSTGASWSIKNTGSGNVRQPCYANGVLVCPIHKDSVLVSFNNGESWSTQSLTGISYSNCVAYGNSVFVVTGNTATINTGTANSDWVSRTSVGSGYLWGAVYANNKFVVCGDNGVIGTSTTGTSSWTSRTSNTSSTLYCITYGGGLFLAAGTSGAIVSSSNGESWTLGSGASGTIMGITYGNGLYLAANSSGQIYHSQNGVTWSSANSPSSLSMSGYYGNHLCYSDAEKRFCVVGDSGKIYTADWAEASAPSTIKFSNTSTYTSQQTVSSQTTYTFSASQITGGSAGNYYFDFDMSNIKLVSATITCDVPTTTVSAGDSVTKTVADVIDFTNGNKTSKNALAGTSTHILTTTISGSTSNSLYKVQLHNGATISSAVRGKLKLTVYPVAGSADVPGIRLRKGTSDTEGLRYDISGRTEIEVPDEYLLSDSSDSTRNKCILTLNLFYVYILNATLTNWMPRFNKISSPKRSSVVDYSQNVNSKPVYNSDLIDFTIGASTAYDDNLGYWVAGKGSNNFRDQQLYSKNDFYMSIEEYNWSDKSIPRNLWYGDGSSNSFSSRRSVIYCPGLSRVFLSANEYLPAFGLGVSGTQPAKHAFIFEGITQPINTVLYEYGVGKNSNLATTDSYVNPSNDFNRTVLKQLTTDACTKLKDAGARVYVVKYRHQANWGAVTRSSASEYTTKATAHSYTEIDNCAANSGGFVRTAADENALKEALNEIATEIKSSGFANYQEATLK